jgi:hypothetical protein
MASRGHCCRLPWTILVPDAHSDGKPSVVGADEKLTAFMELESASRESSVSRTPFAALQPLRNTAQARDGTTKV